MPRNAAGNYVLPLPPVVPGNTIVASFENTTDNDIASELTNSLDRNGRGGMLAPFKIADGTVSAPGIAFTQDPDNGLYRINPDDWALAVGGALLLRFGASRLDLVGEFYGSGGLSIQGGATIAGVLNVTGAVTFGSTLTVAGGLIANGGINVASGGLTVGGAAVLTENRSNTISAPGRLTIIGASVGGMGSAVAGRESLQVQSLTAADGAFMAFHHAGQYASYFGIDIDNVWKVGGWSAGDNAYRLWHEANSFSYEPNQNDLNTQGRKLRASDLTADRGNGSGVMGFPGGHQFYYDTAKIRVLSTSMAIDQYLSVGTASNLTPLYVKIAGDYNFINYLNGGTDPVIGYINDAFTAWQNWSLAALQTVQPFVDNTLWMGAPGRRWSLIYAVNGTIQTSDARVKKNVADSVLGLDFINGLRPVSYQWLNDGNVVTREPTGEVEDVPGYIDPDGTVVPPTTRPVLQQVITPTPGTQTHFGLVAQEVRQAVLAVGVAIDTFGGFVPPHKADPEGLFGLNYGEFIAPLIKAVQELSVKVRVLEGKPA